MLVHIMSRGFRHGLPLPSKLLLERVRRSDSSKSYRVCARGVALSDHSFGGATVVVKGGGDIGLFPIYIS